MGSKEKSASRWLNEKIREAKGAYVAASVFTVVSAACFVAFCWYLSGFAALWVDEGLVLPRILLCALLFLTGRYVFAYFASLFNYKAGNIIVSKIKKKLYPVLLNDSQADSVSATLFVTRVSDDLKPYFAFLYPMPWLRYWLVSLYWLFVSGLKNGWG
ncbi:MAG: hypothetical protein LUH15_10110 [Tannerellaceae bacterium]|nr:hypothetical protein [Tannerellaceae bacterium]